ncbi:oxidoreductase [Streptacidiphilus sp. PAMC 29251]
MAKSKTGKADRGNNSAVPKKWNTANIPSQAGALAVVTGANSGLGLVTARELARAGAQVVLACRDTGKGQDAASELRAAVPGARLDVQRLDLADLDSVRTFAADFSRRYDHLDLLINNAGVMAPPRRTTADGFELQLGTNHLGHFALTGLLLPRLLAASDPRVVTVSSTLHAYGRIDLDDLQREKHYQRYLAYGQSKLANLLFTFELDRRSRTTGTQLRAMAAHPGYAATNLQLAGLGRSPLRSIMAAGNQLFALSPLMGALPTLCAATQPDLPGGSFLGPSRMMGYRGHPGLAKAHKRATDQDTARRLWDLSEAATGVRFSFTADTLQA